MSSDPELVPGYYPFIGDVPMESKGEPFVIPNPDTRSEDEINEIVLKNERFIKSKYYHRPHPLSTFCLLAQERWKSDDEDSSEVSLGVCLLL